ncbi:MAG: hypothetical protein ABSH21_08565 [Verrucomicrobiia bacterium]
MRFYVEAKKPLGDIATADHYFQTIRYGYGSKNPVAVLSDFAQFHVLDCRYKPNEITEELTKLRGMLADNPDGLAPEALKAKHQQAVLEYIERQLLENKFFRALLEEREEKEEEAREAASVLPSSDVLDKIMRYETTLERQLYRAMNQLERLQRRRNGEVVPPPITMEVAH